MVYGEGARQILARDPLDQPPLAPVFDSSTDKTYVNQFLPSAPVSLDYRALVFDGTMSSASSSSVVGQVLAADGPRGFLYLAVGDAQGLPTNHLEARDSATLALAPAQIDTDAYWIAPDPALDRLYVRRLHDIAVFDRPTGASLGNLPLGADFIDRMSLPAPDAGLTCDPNQGDAGRDR